MMTVKVAGENTWVSESWEDVVVPVFAWRLVYICDMKTSNPNNIAMLSGQDMLSV